MGRAQVSQDERAISPHLSGGAADAPRSVTTYRVAMLTIAPGPILCLVRALSARAATLDIDMPFSPQDNAILEIGRERISGALVKTGDRKAELRSREPIDISAVLADPSLLASAGRRTLPRVAVDARARIDIGAQRFTAQVRDISTDGIRIFTEELLSIGDEVRVVLKGLERPLPGIVRWCSGDYAGIEFIQRLPISRLNAWLSGQSPAEPEAGETHWSSPIVSKS
jgi:hypothetical protein